MTTRLPLLSRSCIVTGLCAAFAVAQNAQPPAETEGNKTGFLTGLRGFEKFHEPVGQPLYFETPFNDTGVKALYIRHNFAKNSALAGGNVTVYALQARAALTERLAFIATKDGYSEIETGTFGNDEGWNDVAAGLKYVAIADRANDFVVTPGVRYMLSNGRKLYGAINGTTKELSPFVSVAKGFDRLHWIGNATLRVPTDSDKGNTVGHWDLHVDYDLNPDSQAVFAPVLELHGLHYLDDGQVGLPIGGGDYTNLGSQPNSHFVCWASAGFRFEMLTKYEVGFVYEFVLTDADKDIWKDRVTIDFCVRL